MATITARGTVIAQNAAAASASQALTLNTSTWTAGDLILGFFEKSSTTITVTGISGGGADSLGWQQIVVLPGTSTANYTSIWWARLGTPASNTVTITWSASPGSPQTAFQGFTAGLGPATPWVVLDSNKLTNATGAAIPFPTLNASDTSLYFGVGSTSATGTGTSAGATAGGWVWQTDGFVDAIAYNLAIGPGGVAAPSATNNPTTTTSNSIAVLMGILGGQYPVRSDRPVKMARFR